MAQDYTMARKGVDKFELYQWAVQDADEVVDFTVEQYKRLRGKKPLFLREDFCGTALVASRWVRGHPKRQAIGLDLDRPTLEWAEEHNLHCLGKSRKQIELRECDVRTITTPKADVVQAFNFSYFLFYEIKDLVEYFRSVRASLAADGVFLLDCFGGWESQQPHIERRLVETPEGSFGFAWEIKRFNPIEQRAQCRIHFEFKNGKRWKNVFKYGLSYLLVTGDFGRSKSRGLRSC